MCACFLGTTLLASPPSPPPFFLCVTPSLCCVSPHSVCHTSLSVSHPQSVCIILNLCITPSPCCVTLCHQILEHVAASLGKDSAEVKAANFLPEATAAIPASNSSSAGGGSSDSSSAGRGGRAGDSSSSSGDMRNGVSTVLGRVLPPECYTLPRLWRQLLSSSDYASRVAAVRSHNESHAWSKRGIVVTPVRWGVIMRGGGGWGLVCPSACGGACVKVYARLHVGCSLYLVIW